MLFPRTEGYAKVKQKWNRENTRGASVYLYLIIYIVIKSWIVLDILLHEK